MPVPREGGEGSHLLRSSWVDATLVGVQYFPQARDSPYGSSLHGGWGTWRGGELLWVPSEELGNKPAILHLPQMLLTCRGQNSHYQSLDSLANKTEAGRLLDLFWCLHTKWFLK